jgi:membrane protein required for colicin V production
VNQLDAIVVVLLVPFGLRGLWRGLLREGCGLAGVIGGVFAGVVWGPEVARLLEQRAILGGRGAHAVALVAIFAGVCLVAHLLGALLDRLARAILLGGLNRTAGLAFGLAKGAAVLGFALLVLQRLVPGGALAEVIETSTLGGPLTQFALGVVEVGRGLAGDLGRPST